MKLSQKEKCLLLILAGILILFASWFLAASQLRMKTDEIKALNIGLKNTAEQYQTINARIDKIQEKIPTLQEERERIISMYPSNMTREDEIMFWANMDNTFPKELALSSLTMGTWDTVIPSLEATNDSAQTQTQETETDGAESNETELADPAPEDSVQNTMPSDTANQPTEESEGTIKLFKAPINYSFVATYQGLKDMLNFLFLEGDRKNVETLSVTFDSATGNLSGSMDINLFFMTGTGRNYSNTTVPAVQKGVTDIFHTVNGASINQTEKPEVEQAAEEELTTDEEE